MLNPVAFIFSKIKNLIKGESADNFGQQLDLLVCNNTAVIKIRPKDCQGYMIHIMRNMALVVKGIYLVVKKILSFNF